MLKHFKQLNKCLYRGGGGGGSISSLTTTHIRKQEFFSASSSSAENLSKEWTTILARAEKVVGYPTSFLNLRYLVSDEVANFANLLRKLIKTNHPLIKMARTIVSPSSSATANVVTGGDLDKQRSSPQFNGLILLLISKAAGVPFRPDTAAEQLDSSAVDDGIHRSQRSLAEISEMIYMGSLIHKGIVDLSQYSSSEYTSMDQGNKIAVLCGDYLLANACRNLSKLQNTEVVAIMSQVIADISQSIFIRGTSGENLDQLNSKLSLIKLWYDSANSDSSSLLANSAKASLLLVKHSTKTQEAAANFARNLDLAYKIWSDLIAFKKDCNQAINKSETIVNAIYKDKYDGVQETTTMTTNERRQHPKQKVAVSGSSSSSSVKKSASSLSFLSTFYPSFKSFSSSQTTSSPPQQQLVDELLYDRIFADCKSLFESHYRLAIDNLAYLENEHSEREALASLKSMLNVMNSTV